MQSLTRQHVRAGEPPRPVFPLHDQVQRTVQLAIQPPRVPLLVLLRPPRSRRLDRHPLRLRDLFAVLADADLGVEHQRAAHALLVRQLRANTLLVVEQLAAVRAVYADVLGGRAAPLGQLDGPVERDRRVLLEVRLAAEWRAEPFVEPFLVEEECRFERQQWPREQRRACEDDARLELMRRLRQGNGLTGRRRIGGERRR